MMSEKTYVGVLAITFGLFFFVVSLLTIFLPGFGELHLALLASLSNLIAAAFPSLKDMAFPLAMFADWILVFGLGFGLGVFLIIEIRKRNRGKWNEFALRNSVDTANSFWV